MGEWQPIETAPKDGTPILLYSRYAEECGERFPILSGRHNGPFGWVTYSESGDVHNFITDYEPTHWMRLPPAPHLGVA